MNDSVAFGDRQLTPSTAMAWHDVAHRFRRGISSQYRIRLSGGSVRRRAAQVVEPAGQRQERSGLCFAMQSGCCGGTPGMTEM
jgi:hypothetical protein